VKQENVFSKSKLTFLSAFLFMGQHNKQKIEQISFLWWQHKQGHMMASLPLLPSIEQQHAQIVPTLCLFFRDPHCCEHDTRAHAQALSEWMHVFATTYSTKLRSDWRWDVRNHTIVKGGKFVHWFEMIPRWPSKLMTSTRPSIISNIRDDKRNAFLLA